MSWVYCLVSGGMDSVVACHYFMMYSDVKNIVVVHARTPLEDPRNIEYVKEYARWLGARLVITEPLYGLEKILDWGLPGLRNRWCMRVWKQEPLRKVIPYGSTIVLGIRRNESRARKKRYAYGFKDKYYVTVMPILDWTKQQVLDHIKKYEIPKNPLWKQNGHSSHDCSICLLYAKPEDIFWLMNNYTEKYKELINILLEAKKRKGQLPRFLNKKTNKLIETIIKDLLHKVPRTSPKGDS